MHSLIPRSAAAGPRGIVRVSALAAMLASAATPAAAQVQINPLVVQPYSSPAPNYGGPPPSPGYGVTPKSSRSGAPQPPSPGTPGYKPPAPQQQPAPGPLKPIKPCAPSVKMPNNMVGCP